MSARDGAEVTDTTEFAIDDRERGYCVTLPKTTPLGQTVSIQTGVRKGAYVMHAETSDQHELYFEVTAYPNRRDHAKLAAEQLAFLRDRAPAGRTTVPTAGSVGRLNGLTFDFSGVLQGRFKERRFLFVDTQARTYRLVFDPTSALNECVLDRLAFYDP